MYSELNSIKSLTNRPPLNNIVKTEKLSDIHRILGNMIVVGIYIYIYIYI